MLSSFKDLWHKVNSFLKNLLYRENMLSIDNTFSLNMQDILLLHYHKQFFICMGCYVTDQHKLVQKGKTFLYFIKSEKCAYILSPIYFGTP